MASNAGDAPNGIGEKTERDHPRKVSNSSDTSQIENQASNDNMIDDAERERREKSAKLQNPLGHLTAEQLSRQGEEFCAQHGLTSEEDIRAFRLGAMLAGNMNKYDTLAGLTDRERDVLDRETTHKWSNPGMLYAVIVICSLCAAVQGMDETVVNGAQGFYKSQFGIGDSQSQRGRSSNIIAYTNSIIELT